MTRRRIVNWDEQDVHNRWRKLYCWTQRRRERREGKAETRSWNSD